MQWHSLLPQSAFNDYTCIVYVFIHYFLITLFPYELFLQVQGEWPTCELLACTEKQAPSDLQNASSDHRRALRPVASKLLGADLQAKMQRRVLVSTFAWAWTKGTINKVDWHLYHYLFLVSHQVHLHNVSYSDCLEVSLFGPGSLLVGYLACILPWAGYLGYGGCTHTAQFYRLTHGPWPGQPRLLLSVCISHTTILLHIYFWMLAVRSTLPGTVPLCPVHCGSTYGGSGSAAEYAAWPHRIWPQDVRAGFGLCTGMSSRGLYMWLQNLGRCATGLEVQLLSLSLQLAFAFSIPLL